MGGLDKGLFLAPDSQEPLVVRLARLSRGLGLEPVLVGDRAAYRAVLPELSVVVDDPEGVGPLGGLSGLLKYAESGRTIALACDLPRLSQGLLARLANEPCADVLAPLSETGKWEPLCAAYDAARVRPHLATAIARGVRSFQKLFRTLTVSELRLNRDEQRELRDWDRPEDLQG